MKKNGTKADKKPVCKKNIATGVVNLVFFFFFSQTGFWPVFLKIIYGFHHIWPIITDFDQLSRVLTGSMEDFF